MNGRCSGRERYGGEDPLAALGSSAWKKKRLEIVAPLLLSLGQK